MINLGESSGRCSIETLGEKHQVSRMGGLWMIYGSWMIYGWSMDDGWYMDDLWMNDLWMIYEWMIYEWSMDDFPHSVCPSQAWLPKPRCCGTSGERPGITKFNKELKKPIQWLKTSLVRMGWTKGLCEIIQKVSQHLDKFINLRSGDVLRYTVLGYTSYIYIYSYSACFDIYAHHFYLSKFRYH